MDLLLPHQGSSVVGCLENAPHAKDQSPHSGSVQATGANPSRPGPTAWLGLRLSFVLLLPGLHGCLLGSAGT